MRTITTLLLCSLFTLHFSLFAQQDGWTDISANLPELGGFNDVHFIGDEGWITGGYNKIYYTPDGGATFSIQQLPAGSGISSSVFMKSATEGYAVTFSGKILHYENNTWTTLHEPGGVINAVNFPPDSDTGYTCGGSGTVWSFNDTSITDISPPNNASNLQ